MRAATQREQYIAMASALAALLLAGVLLWEWDVGLGLERGLLKMHNIAQSPVRPLNILPEFELVAEDPGFSELISRSLFSVSRRSTAVASKGGVASMKKGQFVLVGVLITPTQRSALLRDVQTNKAETIALNGLVRGITVGEVDASRVVLRQGAESEELALNVQMGPKGAVLIGLPPPPVPVTATAPPAQPVSPAPAASAPAKPAATASAPLPTGPPRGDAKK